MAVILRGAVKLYYYLNEDIADARTQDWFLIRTPWPGLALLSVYLVLVYRWLPRFMRGRPAYDLREVLAMYNVVQILGCSYVVYQSLVLGWLRHYSLVCQPIDDGDPYTSVEYAWKVCYGYFIIKLLDLLDTIFFLLRKKTSQVTFLHVYHHCGMVAVAWGIVKWVPGGHVTFTVSVNSFVHVIMYTYYLMSVWNEAYKNSFWWKKHVTQVQIIQFTVLLTHFISLLLVRECSFPPQPAYILIPQNLFMVLLFGDFYYRAYIKTSKTL